jgi:hypothetical protein
MCEDSKVVIRILEIEEQPIHWSKMTMLIAKDILIKRQKIKYTLRGASYTLPTKSRISTL